LLVAVPTLEYSTKCAATTAAAAAKPPQPQHVSPLVVLVLDISIDIMNFQRLDHVKLSSY